MISEEILPWRFGTASDRTMDLLHFSGVFFKEFKKDESEVKI